MIPFFSVIIPAYNCERTLKQTLDSVLTQTYDNYEIIIINDYSTDETLHIITNYCHKYSNIKLINNATNLGVAKSRNRGFEIASGKFIAFIDSDDLWDKNKLLIQKNYIEETNCDVCYTSYDFIDEDGAFIRLPYIVPSYTNYENLLKQNILGCSSVVVRKCFLDKYKMNSDFYHEDYALWLMLARNIANFAGINDVLMHYRISSRSRSYNKLRSGYKRLEIYIKQENLSIFKIIKCLISSGYYGIKKVTAR